MAPMRTVLSVLDLGDAGHAGALRGTVERHDLLKLAPGFAVRRRLHGDVVDTDNQGFCLGSVERAGQQQPLFQPCVRTCGCSADRIRFSSVALSHRLLQESSPQFSKIRSAIYFYRIYRNSKLLTK